MILSPSFLFAPIRAARRSGAVLVLGLAVGLAVAALPDAAAAQTDGSSPPSPDSLDVEAVVDQVLDTYPTVEAARRAVDAAAARVGQARSGYWPRVSAVGSYQRQDPVSEVTLPGELSGSGGGGGTTIGIQPNNLYDGHLLVEQTIYDFGRTRSRIEQAEAGRMTASREVEAERGSLAFETLRTFYTALLATERISVQQRQIEQLERTLEVVRRQKEAGTATEFEIQSTQTRLSAARSQLTQLRNLRRSQKADLRRLLGQEPGTPLPIRGRLRPPLSVADTGRIDADSLARIARRQHPSVQVARARVRAAERGAAVVDASDAPSLNLTAQGGVRNGYPNDLNEPRLNESIGVSLRIPLFEGFSTRRRLQEAEAETQAAEARLTDARRRVTAQVEQSAADLQSNLDQLASTQLRVEQAQTAAELARTRYEAGTITNLDLLEAETELQQARLARTEIRYRVVLSWYALQRASGTLLPFVNATR